MSNKPFYRRRFIKGSYERFIRYPLIRFRDFLYGVIFLCPKLKNPALYFQNAFNLLERGKVYTYDYEDGTKIQFRAGTNDTDIQIELIGCEQYKCFSDEEVSRMVRIVDLGGQIGTFTIWMLNKNKKLQSVCVEAVPENAVLAQKNLSLNHMQNRVTLVSKAAWKTTDDNVTIYLNERNSSGHSIKKGKTDFGNKYEDSVNVSTISLNDIIDRKFCDLLKIDVEGSEYPILETASDETWELIGSIVMETHGEREDNEWLDSLLTEKGFLVNRKGVQLVAKRINK